MSLKIALILALLGCLVFQGYAKPVETDDGDDNGDDVVELNEVEEGAAAIIIAIGKILERADDIKASELRALAENLLETTTDFHSTLDDKIKTASNGKYSFKNNPDIVIERPQGSPQTRLTSADQFIVALFSSLDNFQKAMESLVEKYDESEPAEALAYLKVLKQITWGIRQVGRTLVLLAEDAEQDAEAMVLASVVNNEANINQDKQVEEKMEKEIEAVIEDDIKDVIESELENVGHDKALKKRNWNWKLDGLHWNRGNHDFKVGPTFGNGGFGGGATYTFRFK